jgi:hypothetical protein
MEISGVMIMKITFSNSSVSSYSNKKIQQNAFSKYNLIKPKTFLNKVSDSIRLKKF